MLPLRILFVVFASLLTGWSATSDIPQALTTPIYLDDQFDLSPGFRIYQVAGPELTGGSYDIAFDGQGRLLVGDGTAVRRLIDSDQNGVFDRYEVLANGLGWRGPQGLLVYGDRLYATGGDGIQLYEGYNSGNALTHRGRLGNPLKTGNDHEGHSLVRGWDGYIYFVAGDGAEAGGRTHISEKTSPVMSARSASVFRISPDGRQWECVSTGGRNPPNLGINYLGDLFSLDSDMEWHVALPWYRPVTLNHWLTGGDQGWQDVGAFPRYYVDCLPGILEIGRGSPDWGIFYEHVQFPERYRNAYLVCDYRWKMASADRYANSGRLLAFFLKRSGAGWAATMEVLAKAKPGAKNAMGKLINFALVDIDVAPDGSIFASDHNQGIWRIIYDPEKRAGVHAAAPITPDWPALPATPTLAADAMLALPQPSSERTRLREEELRPIVGLSFVPEMQAAALNGSLPIERRLRALRLLAPEFATLGPDFLLQLSRDASPELRGQAAWLLGIRNRAEALPVLAGLLKDSDGFVRRRAAEAMTRFSDDLGARELVDAMADPERLVRHAAMAALMHRPSKIWQDNALSRNDPQILARALVAGAAGEEPIDETLARRTIASLLALNALSRQDQLDILRILALFQKTIEKEDALRGRVVDYVVQHFPDSDRDVRWEQIRLLGAYRAFQGFGKLLQLLESEKDEVTQFHIAQSIVRLPSGWTSDEEERLVRWFSERQKGWFAEFADKGVEFPDFWATVLMDLTRRHRQAVLASFQTIDLASLMGRAVIQLLVEDPASEERLLGIYRGSEKPEAKLRIIESLRMRQSPGLKAFLLTESRNPDVNLRGAALKSLASQRLDAQDLPLLSEGLSHSDSSIVQACAEGLKTLHPSLEAHLAALMIARMEERRDLLRTMNATLASLTGIDSGLLRPDQHIDDALRAAVPRFWKDWYERAFHQKFQSQAIEGERNDEQVLKVILASNLQSGNARRGARVYERLQCNGCHGGGISPGQEGRIFGPELSGVTRRLSRAELAEALVYPSKQVADRFKAVEIALKDGESITGFVTERSIEAVTIATREQVSRIPMAKVESIAPQATSLMPQGLFNRLSDEEVNDLLGFLDRMGTPLDAEVDHGTTTTR